MNTGRFFKQFYLSFAAKEKKLSVSRGTCGAKFHLDKCVPPGGELGVGCSKNV